MNLAPVKVDQHCLHTFISTFLDPSSNVVDLGAHRGQFSEYIVENFQSTVYALEPVPGYYQQIPNYSSLHKYQLSVSDESGTAEMNVSASSCPAHSNLDPDPSQKSKKIKVNTTTLEKFLKRERILNIDLMKVDIEGAEIPVLQSLSNDLLKRIDQITVEFHDFLDPDLKSEVERIKQQLINHNFYCIPFSMNNGDILFVKRSLLSMGTYLYLRGIVKYFRGGIRWVSHRITSY